MKTKSKAAPASAIKYDEDDCPILTPELLAKAKPVGPMVTKDSTWQKIEAPEGITRYRVVHGGARPGAGRKPTGHVRLSLNVSPRAKAALQRRAKKEHKTLSAVIEELIAAA